MAIRGPFKNGFGGLRRPGGVGPTKPTAPTSTSTPPGGAAGGTPPSTGGDFAGKAADFAKQVVGPANGQALFGVQIAAMKGEVDVTSRSDGAPDLEAGQGVTAHQIAAQEAEIEKKRRASKGSDIYFYSGDGQIKEFLSPGRTSLMGHSLFGNVGLSSKALVLGGTLEGSAAPGLTHAGKLLVGGLHDAGVAQMGPYRGDNPALSGKEIVVAHKKVGGSATVAVGAWAGVGIGASLQPSKGSSVLYRTHLDKPDADALTEDKNAAVGFLREKAESVGLKKLRLDIPDIAKPETMRVGDELVVATHGGVRAGVFAFGVAVGVGASATLHGEFELHATKLDDHRVHLTVNPTRVRAMSYGVNSLGTVSLDLHRTESKSLTQAFVFDLSTPSGKQAYLDALSGNLPHQTGIALDKDRSVTDLETYVREEQLPVGVERTYLERADLSSRDIGARVGIPIRFGKNVWWGLSGLARSRAKVDHTRTGTDGDQTKRVETRGVEDRWEVLLSGTETVGAFASLREHTVIDEQGQRTTTFGGLDLTARFEDDRVMGLELNDEVLDVINGVFGTAIAPFAEAGHRQARTIEVKATLSAADLATLSQVAGSDATALATAKDLDQADLAQMLDDVRAAQTPADQSRAVLGYLSKNGIARLGAVFALAGRGAEELTVDTWSTSYHRPLDDARALEQKYPEPLALDAGKWSLVRRFGAAHTLMVSVDRAAAELADDPILGDKDKADVLAHLAQAAAVADQVASFDHLSPDEQQALRTMLDVGYTTTVAQQVIDRLDEAAA